MRSFTKIVKCGYKEYISLVERTATTHCLTKSQLTQPLTGCSVGNYTDGQVVQYTADRVDFL